MANEVITITARRKMAMARAEGTPLPKVTHIAFGNGGADADGNPIEPLDTAVSLNSEFIRKEIVTPVEYRNDDKTTARFAAVFRASECAGEVINEMALIDSEDDVVCIKTFTPKIKDGDMETEFSIDLVF